MRFSQDLTLLFTQNLCKIATALPGSGKDQKKRIFCAADEHMRVPLRNVYVENEMSTL